MVSWGGEGKWVRQTRKRMPRNVLTSADIPHSFQCSLSVYRQVCSFWSVFRKLCILDAVEFNQSKSSQVSWLIFPTCLPGCVRTSKLRYPHIHAESFKGCMHTYIHTYMHACSKYYVEWSSDSNSIPTPGRERERERQAEELLATKNRKWCCQTLKSFGR